MESISKTTNKTNNKENKMKWQTPPKKVRYKRSNRDWAAIADSLKKSPGEWALVAENVNPSTVTHIRYGRLKAFEPAGQFESSGHGRNEEGYTKELFARYVGASASATGTAEIKTPATTVASASYESPAVDFFSEGSHV
jgi:hypothetical protein